AAYVNGVASLVGLSAVQLHGDETPAFAVEIRRPVIKAIAIGGGTDGAVVDGWADRVTLLLDADDPQKRGGTGRTIDWTRAETLVQPVEALERAYFSARDDEAFIAELDRLLKHYAGRPTPVYEARRLAAASGGARIFLKREDLTHTGAHKINNALGQALLAVRMGKQRIVAETGAGQHGVATATACAL